MGTLIYQQYLACLCILLALPGLDAAPRQCSGYGQFFGGSVSYTMEEIGGKFTLHLDVITGWVLGMGPCGRNCTKASVGKSTKPTRLQIENETNDTRYFGDWSSETKQPNQPIVPTDITDKIRADMNETVLAVSETSKWEQELMHISLPVEDNLTHKDINYDGCSWRNLSHQGELLPWHIQAKVDPVEVRSDTKKPNGSPQVLYKPFYRLKLNKESTIQIAATDPDDDYVKCGESEYVESGVFALKTHKLPGVTIEEDCSIKINASYLLGFRDQDWAAIFITVRDFNKQPIHFGNKIHNIIAPGMFSLSSTAVQFLVLVLANLEEPEFVKPTIEGNHLFHLYADTIWTTEVYAKANGNATLEEFIVIARGGEKFTQSVIKDDIYRAGVKHITISWEPPKTDVGNHLICVRAVDNTGVDSSMDRCFVINVSQSNFTGVTHVATGQPYFYNIPRLQDLTCEIDTTCVIPVYVKTHSSASIVKIRVTQMYVDDAHLSSILQKGQNDFKADLYFRDSKSGVNKMCLIAEDSNGVQSNETCIESDIIPKDPCAALPCANSAVCKRNPSDPADYQCICSSKMFSGKKCDKHKQECDPNPCLRGTCNASMPVHRQCQCPFGFGGMDCGTRIMPSCSSVPCHGHGVCRNGPVDYTCDCYQRYSGKDCATDLCPSPNVSSAVCPVGPGCSANTCNSHGVCSNGGKCTCSYGYIGQRCQTAKGDLQTPMIQFVPPTPEEASSITCYFSISADCKFTVYITTPQSSSSNVLVSQQSPELEHTTSVGPVELETAVTGIQNLFKATVTITKGHVFQRDVGGRRYLCLRAFESSSNTSDNRCFEIVLVYNSAYVANSREFIDSIKKLSSIKFVLPTPLGESTFVCQKDLSCHIFLHTTRASPCNEVITTHAAVTVFPPVTDATSCLSEVSYLFTTTGDKRICFVAALNSSTSDTRCFNIRVFENTTDPCIKRPCQNGGICFHKGMNDRNCICPPKFSGSRCEKGPCLPTENICSTGFCFIDNSAKTCLCPIGYTSSNCSQKVPTTVPDPEHKGAVFTDSAIPDVITCIKNKPCTVPFLLSGNYTTTPGVPNLKPGYVDPSVSVDYIDVTGMPSSNGSFQGHVQLTSGKPGLQDVCIQTADRTGINRDEICFSIDVKTDTSTLYGFNGLPHFTEPSIPAASAVRCGVGEPCHLFFHVSPGNNYTGECVTVEETKENFQNLHVFSSCECADGEVGTCTPCSPGQSSNNNCTIDVSILPEVAEMGAEIEMCLLASLKTKGLTGEERCINITVEDLVTHRRQSGCQLLHCQNGGYCDGHSLTLSRGGRMQRNAICYCPFGFTGHECGTDNTKNTTVQPPEFLATGLPNEVKCYQNETCQIPFQVVGNSLTSPEVTTGYVDPHLKGAVVDVYNGSISTTTPVYNGTITVGTPDVGQYKMCLQTLLNKAGLITDEKCFTVNVEGKTRPPVDATKPHFLQPSPTSGSTITCVAKTSCFISLFYTSGDLFGLTGTCPVLSQSSISTQGLHIFAAKYFALTCSSMLNYIAQQNDVGNTYQLCFRVSIPGKRGEDRCFNIEVKGSSVNIGPCNGGICLNGGRCIANINSQISAAECVCQRGYSQGICTPVSSMTLQRNTTGLPGTPPPVFTDSAVPDRVICYSGRGCRVPLSIHGSTNPSNGPDVEFGHTDPGIDPGTPSVTPTQPSGFYTAVVPFTPENGTSGLHKVCIQTKDPVSRINVDEICFDVDVVSSQNNSARNQGASVILPPTFNNNGSFSCKIGSACHIHMTYSKGVNNTRCPVLTQTTAVDNLLSFLPKEQNNTCFVDTVLTPSTSQAGKLLPVCLQPRGAFDTRCYDIKISNTDSQPGLCHGLHCQNSGFCDHVNGQAVCVCKPEFSGSTCQNVSTPLAGTLPGVNGTNLPNETGTSHFDNPSAIPRVVKCEANKPCQIPILFHGNSSNPPILGHVDSSLMPVTTQVRPVKPPDTHLILSTVNTTTAGSFCIQTVGAHSKINIDEICVDILVENNSSPIDKTLPHFQPPSLKNGSAVICLSDQTCYLPVATSPYKNRTCAQPSICSRTTMTGIHPFESQLKNGICITVVAVAPSKNSQQGDVCITAGPGGEQRVLSVNQKPSSKASFGPCQTLHCENGGTCDQINGRPFCHCLPDFTGTNCSEYITTTASTTDAVTTTQTTEQTTTVLPTTSSPTTLPSTTSSNTTAALTTSATISTTVPITTSSATLPTTSSSTTVSGTNVITTVPTTTSSTTLPTTILGTTAPAPTHSTTAPTMPTTNSNATVSATTTSTKLSTPASSTTAPTTSSKTTLSTSASSTAAAITTPSTTLSTPASNITVPTANSNTKLTTSAQNVTVSASSSITTLSTLASSTAVQVTTPSTTLSTLASDTTVPATSSITTFSTPASSTAAPVATPSTTLSTLASNTTVPATSSMTTLSTPASSTTVPTSFINTTLPSTASSVTLPTTPPSTTLSTTSANTVSSTKFLSSSSTAPTTQSSTSSSTSTSGAGMQIKTTSSTTFSTNSRTSVPTSRTNLPFTPVNTSTKQSTYTGTCNMKEASEKAREAVKLGRASCYCTVNGTKKEIIRRRPVATTKQLLKSAGIGAGGSIGAMLLVALVYLVISKIRLSMKESLRRRPTPSPRSGAKVHPQR